MVTQRLWHNIASVAGACIVGYFLYHTIQGGHGWLAMARLKGEVGVARNTLAQLHKERETLSHRVDLLRSSHLDPDLLDEESRAMLNYSRPNEVIILTSPTKTR